MLVAAKEWRRKKKNKDRERETETDKETERDRKKDCMWKCLGHWLQGPQ